jgi:uroporphyrinogen-III synthase
MLTITATFRDNALYPDQPLDLPNGTRVRLQVKHLSDNSTLQEKLDELDAAFDQAHVYSTEPRMTRDELHDRN